MKWLDEEVKFLKVNYPNSGASYCSEKLGKTENSIIKKASQLKIKVNKRSKNSKNKVKIKNTIKIECKICNKEIDVIGEQSFYRFHLAKYHKIKTKDYYDRFFKKENEGLCENCGEQTILLSIAKGYNKYCSRECCNNDPNRIIKIKITKKLKYNNENYNNRENADQTCLKKYGVKNVSSSEIIKKKKIETCLKNHGVENYTTTDEYKEKTKKTCLEKYNVDNPSKCEKFKEKRSQTIFKKYGVYHYSTSREYRLLKEKLNEWIPLEQKSDFEIYSRNVWNETKKFKKKLFAKWDGKCYYTKIELDKNQHYNNETYPSVDHKISVFFGFSNNIDPIEIGKIDNLCICSRWSNHRKGIMNEEKFIEYLNENNFFNEK